MKHDAASPDAANKRVAIDFSGGGAFREPIAGGGRVHVDRPLPCLILHRHQQGAADSLASRVATTSAAYLVWPASDEGDARAIPMLEAVVAAQRASFDRILLVSLYDLPRDPSLDGESARLEDYRFVLGASEDAPALAAAKCLASALATIEVDLRLPEIADGTDACFDPAIAGVVEREPALSHIALGLPQNYRRPGEDAVYPQLLHDLAVGIFDALLQGAWAFFREISPHAPPHHRALGRSSFIAAARTVDRKLDRVASSFDFLLSISPINTAQAWESFREGGHKAAPAFHYRPLAIDPELAKRRLHAIDFRLIEDPVLEALFVEKQQEIDQQLTMLQHRNTASFRYASLMLYGPVEPALVAAANDILDRVKPVADAADSEAIDCHVVRQEAHRVIGQYRETCPEFKAQATIRADIAAGMMVTGGTLLISRDTHMKRARLDALLQHEISVHLLTWVNGNAQGLNIFRSGLAGYEGIQEGLGVFAECAVGGLSRARLRLLAARVVVVDAMVDGASFVEGFRLLRKDHGFGGRAAFNIVARVYRSGGLTKDAIYLRGLGQVMALLAQGRDLTPFWCGKIGHGHLQVIEELFQRGLLRLPRVVPEFLSRPAAIANIARIRTARSFADLLR